MGRLMVLGLAVTVAVAACAVASVAVGRRVRSRRKWRRVLGVLAELEERCATPVGKLKQVVDAMAVEMHAGLASEGGSKLKMLLTFVDRLPNGSEKGTYYALDVGGTNFRVLRVQLGGQRSSILEPHVEQQAIPPHLMTSTSEVPRELTECLEQAMSRKGLNMQVAVLVNDTVGTLALGHYHDEDTVAAVIFGTGTNACYWERTDAIIKCQGLLTTSGGMVINMEWGNFWSSHLPRTSYDTDLDSHSSSPNDQGFEKMISGMYLGEVVRRVLLRMSQESDIFGTVPSRLSLPFIFRTPMISAMHEDDSPGLIEVARILKDVLEIPDVPLKVRKLIVKLCNVVTRRAARLAAAGIGGILKKIGRDGSGSITGGRTRTDVKMRRTVVAVEGSLYTSYTMFREYLHEALWEILGEDIAPHVILKVIEDGPGIGAALLAATYSKDSVCG
ncbi:hexokinase-3-like isoform X6 [Juglans microcarpa x Juglans regia]|uniref:hexokinase-3-like isoform X6 n=1 Tax=Juglans microcarpa x Juglans regia TaxID=2249226 RepID=UPI001B7EA612|nr:hexokinase-3-like isoform X6 [Juglans microcarpa x Juglans regia]